MSLLICRDKCVLFALGCTEAECEVFRLKRVNLILRQEVKNCSAVRICIVDNITGAIVNSVSCFARLISEVVVGVCKASLKKSLRYTALILYLTTEVAERTFYAVKAFLNVVAKIADC